MNMLNFYRAVGAEEYRNYETDGFVWPEREWVEKELGNKRQFDFWDIKRFVDSGGWKAGVNHHTDIPRDVIIKVPGFVEKEFIIRPHWIPQRYINIVNLEFSRVELVYDPRAMLSREPMLLSESRIPELKRFRGL
ncbi:MAG: hypothetical protein AABX35_02170 [Nanoarchaeota archaeon]